MNLKDKYFELCYSRRIHEFSKIDQYKNWNQGKACKIYKSLDGFYQDELNIDSNELKQLRFKFKRFNELYSKYFNEQRKVLFENPEKLLEWYDKQNGSCNYCEITQSALYKIAEQRNGNLTLNQKQKGPRGHWKLKS
jgi:hypothetical protein